MNEFCFLSINPALSNMAISPVFAGVFFIKQFIQSRCGFNTHLCKSPLSYHTPIIMGSITMSDNETLIIRKQNSYIFFMVCKNNCLINAWYDKFYVILILVDGQKSCGQMSLAVKCHLRLNVTCGQMSHGQMSRGQMSRGQMSLAWFDKFYFILILAYCQKSCDQMSLVVKRPAVKCHLRSNVPRSNVTCGQMPRGQMSLRSNVTCGQMSRGQMSCGQMSLAVKCPAVKCQLRSNVT